jgi:hypothetical protein
LCLVEASVSYTFIPYCTAAYGFREPGQLAH